MKFTSDGSTASYYELPRGAKAEVARLEALANAAKRSADSNCGGN